MKLKAFALLDAKVGAFAAPFFFPHVGYAARACADLGADLSTTVGRHPADFVLYEIGEFDDQTGELRRLDVLVSHGSVLAFVPGAAQATMTLGGVEAAAPTSVMLEKAAMPEVPHPASMAKPNGLAQKEG